MGKTSSHVSITDGGDPVCRESSSQQLDKCRGRRRVGRGWGGGSVTAGVVHRTKNNVTRTTVTCKIMAIGNDITHPLLTLLIIKEPYCRSYWQV